MRAQGIAVEIAMDSARLNLRNSVCEGACEIVIPPDPDGEGDVEKTRIT